VPSPVRPSAVSASTVTGNERLYAGYLIVQAVCGVVLWLIFAGVPTVRGWFELAADRHAVMDAFVFADLVVVVLGSGLSAWAIAARKSWAVPIVAFTAGAILYPTLYLIGWVSFKGTGALCLAIMVPSTTLTCWVAYQTWKASR
jgi:hypothetical protein